jgi:hypothetical protein
MLDPQHPVVRTLQRAGYKVTASAYFRGAAVWVCATAHHPKTKRMFHGRNRKADIEEALAALGHAAGLRGPVRQGQSEGDIQAAGV